MTIKEAIRDSGTFAGLSKGSIKAAEKMLYANEAVIYAAIVNVSIVPVNGSLKINVAEIRSKITGALVITSKRVYFCNNVLGAGVSKHILLKDIMSIDDSTSLFGFSKIRICGLTDMFVIDGNARINNDIQQALNTARL